MSHARRVMAPMEGHPEDGVSTPKGHQREARQQAMETCYPCHSRRQRLTDDEWYAKRFLEMFQPTLLEPDLYYPDGQILGEVYVYGSFLQSKMYRAGVTCMDCHDPHTLRLRSSGNALCTSCHNPSGNPEFPQLQKKEYDNPSHHFHPPGTPGASCVSCHAPSRVYMELDARADHSFRIPRPDLSAKLGTPNACNQCHEDKSPAWASRELKKRFGPPKEEHYGTAFHQAWSGDPHAGQRLVKVASDTSHSPFIRASAVSLLRNYLQEYGTKTVLKSASSENPLIRMAAARSLALLPQNERVDAVERLLNDSLRAVRIEAGRSLADAPPRALTPFQQRARDSAVSEYIAGLNVSFERSETRHNLGLHYETVGIPDSAILAYRDAVSLDPRFVPSRMNLINLLNRIGRKKEAEKQLRAAIAQLPRQWEMHYSLGLLLAEEKRMEEAIASLHKAVALVPDSARIRYNLGLAHQHAGQRKEALEQILEAHRLAPSGADIVHALVVFFVQDQRWKEASKYAKTLQKLRPKDPTVKNLQDFIQSKGKR